MVAGVSDFADGFIAKRFGSASLLGSFLDPIADKLMVGTVAVTMAYQGIVPASIVGVVVARDLVLISGTLFVVFMSGVVTVIVSKARLCCAPRCCPGPNGAGRGSSTCPTRPRTSSDRRLSAS